jgi:hypothetical protein
MQESPQEPFAPAPQAPRGRVELELADGSRLVLDEEGVSSPIVHRVEAGGGVCFSLEDVMQRDGQPFAGYRLLR